MEIETWSGSSLDGELWNYKVKGLSGQAWGVLSLGDGREKQETKSKWKILRGTRVPRGNFKGNLVMSCPNPTPTLFTPSFRYGLSQRLWLLFMILFSSSSPFFFFFNKQHPGTWPLLFIFQNCIIYFKFYLFKLLKCKINKYNCGVGEDSWESLGLYRDQTSQS